MVGVRVGLGVATGSSVFGVGGLGIGGRSGVGVGTSEGCADGISVGVDVGVDVDDT